MVKFGDLLKKAPHVKLMLNLFVVDWNEEELFKNIEPFLRQDWNVGYEFKGELYAKLNIESLKPDVILIYLNNSPRKGLYVAQLIRKSDSIREIPIVFVDGNEKNVKKAKKSHPNAMYIESEGLLSLLLSLEKQIV